MHSLKEGAIGASSLEDVVKKKAPRAVWIMLPSGAPTEETVVALSKLLSTDDAILDGGNSFYKDDVRRAEMLKPGGIRYLAPTNNLTNRQSSASAARTSD